MRKRMGKSGPIFFIAIVLVVFNATPVSSAEDRIHEDDSKVSVNDDGVNNGYIYLQVDNTEVLRAVEGKIGIREPNPTNKLDVNGSARIRDLPQDDTLNDIVVADVNGVLHIRDVNTIGGLAFKINTVMDDYTATGSDYTILADASKTDVTIILTSANEVPGQILNIKRIDDSNKNSVIIDGDGQETIDGELTVQLKTKYMSYTIQSDGSNWYIIASYGFMGNSHIGNKNR